MKLPVNDYKITSPYGYRTLQGKEQFHDGIDFVSRKNDRRVFSVGYGLVTYDKDDYNHIKRWVSRADSAGNYVIIKTKIGDKEYYVRYLHLKENHISVNEIVTEGQEIGEYADVGFSFGAHLHLDMYTLDWHKINPSDIIGV